ncbi:hypothetical protein BCR33DRAFT_846547 [Rhizoclosmatium globosum]|uniref:Uncharacterized protein n=1 Tax=Rhizoclosmatium globosum TaxID=329046 RepID=A0A1Y2CV65_9FUNG|nr:hypothetical protein BCR33DRAFT_846547 [Rhizoclosmatium globosum]|eukprot:ORY50857.1 hypothetical protein BCR33DRAFT_846547 [Rhizoclosmatium globosum]
MASDVQVSTGWEVLSSGNLVDIIAIKTNETEVNTDPSLTPIIKLADTELYTMDDEYMGSTGEAEKLDNGLWSTTLFDFEVDTFSLSTVRIKFLSLPRDSKDTLELQSVLILVDALVATSSNSQDVKSQPTLPATLPLQMMKDFGITDMIERLQNSDLSRYSNREIDYKFEALQKQVLDVIESKFEALQKSFNERLENLEKAMNKN